MTNTIALLWILALPGQDLTTYSNTDLNISFKHPKAWKVVKNGHEATFTLPLGGGKTAIWDLKGVVFYSEADRWDTAQALLAKTQKQEVVRQWREDLLGVPWLMIRTKWSTPQGDKVRMSGMMYAALRKKAIYHLIADSDSFDAAEEQMRSALATISTLDGKVPLPEDPEREKTPEELKPHLVPVVIRDQRTTDFHRAPVKVTAKAAGLDVALHLPSGWSASTEGDVLNLKRPGLSGEIKLRVLSTLDSDPAERALIKASSETGKRYDTVENRQDRRYGLNRAGAKVWTTWRLGTSAGGKLVLLEAAGSTKDFYWLMTSSWGSEAAYRKDAKVVESLIQEMSVELPQ